MNKSHQPLFFLAFAMILGVSIETGIAQEQYKRYQDIPGVVKLRDLPELFEPEITFLSKRPKIDGLLDPDLQGLQSRDFSFVLQDRTNKKLPIKDASYRLAYGTDFFYVYVEGQGDKLHFRDRAYQNGDGFYMLLALPRTNNERTDEFYVLACSAVNKQRMAWTRRIFWYYNVDNIFLGTTPDTKLEFKASEGKISFELYLPWKAVHPYHPWLSDGIGFNLCFAKAIGERARNRYIVYPDRYLSAENSKRAYYKLKFQEPMLDSESQTFVLLERNHISRGKTLNASAVTASAGPTEERLVVQIKTSEGNEVSSSTAEYKCGKGLTKKDFEIGIEGIAPGDYTFKWHSLSNGLRGEAGLTILPEFNSSVLQRRLEIVKKRISHGSYSTILFELQDLQQQLDSLKPYETCSTQRLRISRLLGYIEKAEKGEDCYANDVGFFRRAFRSKIDGTLQPYFVFVPRKLDPAKKYPLLVFLHGSASDETDITGFKFLIPPEFIAVGPRARGPSHYYVIDHALKDIAEAIDSAIANYPIDKANIFLSGFSMGGYGVYRTFYEMPNRFKALIVLSGRPDVPKDYSSGEKHPDYLMDKYLAPFKDISIFIYHGKKDFNVPFKMTEQLVEKMRALGIEVEFRVEDDKGHERPSAKTVRAYLSWIGRILKEKNEADSASDNKIPYFLG